ncbi:phage major capsid protein [Streptomyces sp. NBC_01239]|uniref:phage major capsid protein n=1 Tax=Streptomyces sp. NBC_01239 TaxID=2903792 RepID=UPI0022568F41|nr:phage major capsid protein [Streptomyces sp. NBC_01239]MCX4813686.1 phage major capsid protein [Streptomyces sp. NBC_01239]
MAASISNWIPIEWDENTLTRLNQRSAIEGYARGYAMSTDQKRVLRSLGMSVGVGSTYSSDSSTNDYVLLDSVKFTGQFIVDEDDLADADSVVDTLSTKAADWSKTYAVKFDNACVAVTGTGDGSSGTPFNSIYKTVRSNGVTGESYTADDNYVNYNGQASATYASLSSVVAKVEQGLYWNPANSLVIAHPAFRDVFRNTKDTNNMPVFIQGPAGTPDSLFGIPVAWSLGAKTSPIATEAPAGNPVLVVVGDTDALMRGDRTGPEAQISPSTAHDSTDETALKLKVRKAFEVSHPKAVAVLEKTA